MASFFKDNEDLQFYFHEGIDWEPLVRLTEFDYRAKDAFTKTEDAVEFYREIAELVGEFSANEIAPHAAEIDRHGVELVDGEAVQAPAMDAIFRKIAGLGLHGMTLPRGLGGMNCPLLLYFMNSEMMGRADVSVLAHHGFHAGMAMAMLIFSIREGSTEIDPENALTGANYKFERRFRAMEADIAAEGLDFRKMSLESLDQRWRKAKGQVG